MLGFLNWGVLEIRVQATTHKNLAVLRASISREWAVLDEEYVCNNYRACRCRLAHAITAGGVLIE
jgi:hypothetical protein